METALWIVTGLGLCFWLASWAMCARLRAVPPERPNSNRPRCRLSIVIPARNEEATIGRLLRSLAEQENAAHEVIVVDDQSEDRTAELAREHGAIVVAGQPLPGGWLGKPWACRQGAEAATGDWLLFLDADAEFEPGGLDRVLALAGDDMQVHSICPYHAVRAPYEQLSAFFNVTMLLGMNAFTLRGARAREIGLFGQAMLVSRRQYAAVDGHEPVKGEVLENFHLARHFRAAGATCHCWLGKGTLRMRMFPDGLRALVAGWSKGFVSGADNTAKAALVGISLWFSALFMAAIALAFVPLAAPAQAVVIAFFYLLCVAQVFYLFRWAGAFWFLNALLYPVGLIFYQVVFLQAVRRRRRGGAIQWKGRHVG